MALYYGIRYEDVLDKSMESYYQHIEDYMIYVKECQKNKELQGKQK